MIGTASQIITYLLPLVKEDGKRYEVKEHREKRSLSQNAYFHVLVAQIAKVVGSSNTEVKNALIAEYGVYDADMGHVIVKDSVPYQKLEHLHLKPSTKTQVMANGELYRVYYVMRGTHTYNTAEMTRILDAAVEEAKQLGIETLPPEELMRMKQRAERAQENKTHGDSDEG